MSRGAREPGSRTETPDATLLPLSGLRILDLSRLLPGPYCTLLFALMGAEVIKVEDPNGGDYIRYMPPLVGDVSVLFRALNRNKKSVTLNLKHPEGRDVFRRLCRTADGLVESFRPGVLDRLGVGYDILARDNPTLIYLAITGYGQSGPLRDRAGHDPNYNALAGMTGIIGDAGGRPVIPGVQIADVPGGALFGAISFLAALQARARTGRGTFIDVSMTEGSLALLAHHFAKFGHDGQVPAPQTMELNGKYPFCNVYRTKDGRYMTLGAIEPKFWKAFCTAMGKPEWIMEQFPSPERRDAVIHEIEALFETRTQEEWLKVLAPADCCCEPVLDFEQVLQHPQHQHRRMLTKVDHGDMSILVNRLPFLFDARAVDANYTPAPALGADNGTVFREVGVDEKRLAGLKRDGAI
ncbi:MAG: CoA transferase [Nitrospirae bacterium]|nr:CoA transferase [Nitrospirota bacterium]